MSILNLQAFQDWFGDSKVTDPNGMPLVVFRGDRIGKTVFDGRHNSSARVQGSIFFTSEPAVARGYTPGGWRENKMKQAVELTEDEGLYRVYLTLRNPLLVDAMGEDWSSIPVPKALSKALKGNARIQIDDLAAHARRNGYDGLIVENVQDQYGESTQYIAFSPDQIKSATRNSGAFDPDSPDITDAHAGLTSQHRKGPRP